jgi:hypothetical protein
MAVPDLAEAKTRLGSGPESDYGRVIRHPDAARAAASAYEKLPSFDPAAVPAFTAMREEVKKQFDHLGKMGYSVEVTKHDPYYDGGMNPAALMKDLRDNRRLKVLSTATTGGHPFFTNEENDMFRAVHDAFGHAATGRGFDRHGEEAAYLAHARMFSPLARQALATETRGQNSFFNVHNKFAEQKVAVLPRQFTGTVPILGRRAMLAETARRAQEAHAKQGLDKNANSN